MKGIAYDRGEEERNLEITVNPLTPVVAGPVVGRHPLGEEAP